MSLGRLSLIGIKAELKATTSRCPACHRLRNTLPERALFLFGEHQLSSGWFGLGKQFTSKGENLLTIFIIVFVNQLAKPNCELFYFGSNDLHWALDVLLDSLGVGAHCSKSLIASFTLPPCLNAFTRS